MPPNIFFEPGNPPRSKTRTFSPAPASLYAAAIPAGPAPTIIQSYLSLICFLDPFYLYRMQEFRYHLKEVSCNTYISFPEDRCIRIFIDSDNIPGGPHPCYVLWGA